MLCISCQVSTQITDKANMEQKKAYSSKFTAKTDLSNKCNIIRDRKLQETEDRKKRGFLKMDKQWKDRPKLVMTLK